MPKEISYPIDDMRLVMETVRERLRELLNEKKKTEGLTKTSLADAVSIDPSTISKYLSGDRPPTDLEVLAPIARRLGTSVGYLIGEQTHRREGTVTAILTECASMEKVQLDALLAIAKTLTDVREKLPQPPETTDEEPRARSQSNARNRLGPRGPRGRK